MRAAFGLSKSFEPQIAAAAVRQTFADHENSTLSSRGREVNMKNLLVILLVAVVLVAVGTLAVMNNVCKTSQRAWCAPMSTLRHHIKTGRG